MLTIILSRTNFCRMYVCLCKGITDQAIEAAVDAGARSFREVRDSLGVSTQCGKCATLTRHIVDACLSDLNDHPGFYDAGQSAFA